MEAVQNYSEFQERLKKKYKKEERVVCILFMDPSNDDTMGSYIHSRFDYFDKRTGKYVDFFCPGFGYEGEKREFDVSNFVDFVTQIEDMTKWRYYGGTNLLIMRYSGGELCFDKVYDLNFTRMMIDGLITDHRRFLEDIIFSFRMSIDDFMHKQKLKRNMKTLWEDISEKLPEFITHTISRVKENIKLNKYFTPQDLRA